MAFELPPLPYSAHALADAGMCHETLELHHGKHHQAYVTMLNKVVDATPELEGLSLEEVIFKTADEPDVAVAFNNAGQHWNHIHFWNALSPRGGGIPGRLEAKMVEDFGSVARFKDAFRDVALAQFGAGWAWLVLTPHGRLEVTKTTNAASPLSQGTGKVILGLDVWEHSYYLDFRNRRPDYVTNFLGRLANYEFAEANLLASD